MNIRINLHLCKQHLQHDVLRIVFVPRFGSAARCLCREPCHSPATTPSPQHLPACCCWMIVEPTKIAGKTSNRVPDGDGLQSLWLKNYQIEIDPLDIIGFLHGYGDFLKWGYPPNHPFIDRIDHFSHHPASLGYLQLIGKPPYMYIYIHICIYIYVGKL